MAYDQLLYRAFIIAVVVAAYANIYVVQPVLPVLQQEFLASKSAVSLSVSALIAGIALSNLPLGMLADRYRVKPLLAAGGLVIAGAGVAGALAGNLESVVAARFVQGLALPALITCLAAYLSRTLPAQRLKPVMGALVAAQVAGGLIGRLLGGWLHPWLHWRAPLAAIALATGALAVTTAWALPDPGHAPASRSERLGTIALLRRADVTAPYATAFSAFFVFSSIFNYLPFRLVEPGLGASTATITAAYLTYVLGIVAGPVAGHLSHRFGGGRTIAAGTLLATGGVLLTLIVSLPWLVAGLLLLCAGFFAVHAAAAGLLNARVAGGKGRANALYVMFYYVGGFCGIGASGLVYERAGWAGVVGLGVAVLAVPLLVGLGDSRRAGTGTSDLAAP